MKSFEAHPQQNDISPFIAHEVLCGDRSIFLGVEPRLSPVSSLRFKI